MTSFTENSVSQNILDTESPNLWRIRLFGGQPRRQQK